MDSVQKMVAVLYYIYKTDERGQGVITKPMKVVG